MLALATHICLPLVPPAQLLAHESCCCCRCCLQWDDDAIKAAKDELLQELADPSRTMIGPEQLQDVAEAVKESGGCHQWCLLAAAAAWAGRP